MALTLADFELTVDDAKDHLHVDWDNENSIIGLYLLAAYERVVARIECPMPSPEPASLRAAALLFLGDLYANREAQVQVQTKASLVINMAADDLCRDYRATAGI